MRKAILILAYLFSSLSVFGQSDLSRPEVKIEYDRFRDSTSATLSSSYTRSQSGTTLIGFVATVPGQSMKGKTPDVDLVIAQMSDDWMFINGPRTLRVILSDKDRDTLGEMRRADSRVLRSGGVMEQLLLNVPFKTVVKLSQSNKVEMQVGLLEFQLTGAQLDALKDFVSRFN
jgi:hypothetical protein